MLDNIQIVLVNTSHPGNIGAAARAMKTMGLTKLHLVTPRAALDATAYALAAGAQDILDNANFSNNLQQAIHACPLVIGASARKRRLKWPISAPHQCAALAIEQAKVHPVAIVFGPEDNGLNSVDLHFCHRQVMIPANPAYSSLNLAAAVQIIAYEIYLASLQASTLSMALYDNLATHSEMEGYYQHLEKALIAIGYLDPQKPRQLMTRLRRLYNRAQLTKTEIDILRGILKHLCQG